MPGTLRRVGALQHRQWPALALTLLGALAAALVVWLSIRRLRPGHRHSAAASVRLYEDVRVRSLRPLAARPVLLAVIWRRACPKAMASTVARPPRSSSARSGSAGVSSASSPNAIATRAASPATISTCCRPPRGSNDPCPIRCASASPGTQNIRSMPRCSVASRPPTWTVSSPCARMCRCASSRPSTKPGRVPSPAPTTAT